jgi:hypothetical protein
MTTTDAAISRILVLMERSAQLQTESLTKSDASLHAAEQAGRIADKVGINWETEIEPLLGERHTASVLLTAQSQNQPTDSTPLPTPNPWGVTDQRLQDVIGHACQISRVGKKLDFARENATGIGRFASMRLLTTTALQGCLQHILPCNGKADATNEQTRGSLGMTTIWVDFSTLDQWGEAAEYLDCAIFDVDEASPERYAAEITRKSSQLGLKLPCQADIVALPPGTVVPDEFKNRLLLDEAARLKFGSVGRLRIVTPGMLRERFGVEVPGCNDRIATLQQGQIPVVYRNGGTDIEAVEGVDIRSPYGCELFMRLIEEVDHQLDEGATPGAIEIRLKELEEQFKVEFGAEAADEAMACGALLSYLSKNKPGFSARDHASAWRLYRKDSVAN